MEIEITRPAWRGALPLQRWHDKRGLTCSLANFRKGEPPHAAGVQVLWLHLAGDVPTVIRINGQLRHAWGGTEPASQPPCVLTIRHLHRPGSTSVQEDHDEPFDRYLVLQCLPDEPCEMLLDGQPCCGCPEQKGGK